LNSIVIDWNGTQKTLDSIDSVNETRAVNQTSSMVLSGTIEAVTGTSDADDFEKHPLTPGGDWENWLRPTPKADANNDGYVMRTENPAYFEALEKAGMLSADANKDGKLNADEFHDACVKDAFKDVK